MSWKGVLRKAGYDTSLVEDATRPLTLGNIEKLDLKGAVIGDPTCCCGAKHICREMGAEMAWVGANIAVVVFNKKKIRRYRHNGDIPSMQDKGFFPLNYPVKLKVVSPAGRLETTRRGRSGPKGGHSRKPPGATLAGEFRRN